MAITKISYTQVEALANELGSAAANMQVALDEIRQLLNKIGSADVWSGSAAEETKAKFNLLSSKFPEFVNAVNGCKAHLISTAEAYKSADMSLKG